MVKVEDLGMNLLYFQNSKTWDYGTYKILDSDIQNYEARKIDGTLEVSVLERILYSHSNKALNQIKKDIDTKDILNIFTWSDLAGSRFIEALPLIMEAQLSGMITDGNKEIKKGSSYSGAGVDASIDASGFMLSHDRVYKAAEDVWFNHQLDKYEIEVDEDEHGNTTYSLIDEAEGTVTKIVATVVLTDAQKKELEDEVVKKMEANSKFELINENSQLVMRPRAGRDLLMLDTSGRPITPSSPHSVATVSGAEAIALAKAQEVANAATKGLAYQSLGNVTNEAFLSKLKAVGLEFGIFNEFKGVLDAEPSGTHKDLDWYINSIDNHIYLWHNNKWNNIGGGTTATLDKAAILNLLGLTSAQLEVLKRTKELTQLEKDKIASSATLADVAKQQDPKIAKAKADAIADADAKLGNKANSFDEHRLMSTTATPDGVHIKRVNGYHSESSFAGGAFFGIVKDDYSVMASFKFINNVANIRFRDAGGAMQDITLQRIYEIAQLKGKFDNLPDDTNAEIAKKADAGASYTKAETDAKYEPLTTFFAPVTAHSAGFILTDDTGIKDVAIGTQVKLDLKGIDDMMSDPTKIPVAGDKLFIGASGAVRIPNAGGTASLKWETKTNQTDPNIKDNYKTKYFVLKKVSSTEYDFVRLEDKPQVATSGHWETIDPATYNFTEPVKVRITATHGEILTGYLIKYHHSLTIKQTVVATSHDEKQYVWYSNKADKTKMDVITISYTADVFKPVYVANSSIIRNFEIWKEA